MTKFEKVYEQAVERFHRTSFISGDYVNIVSNVKSSDWYKSLEESRKQYVDGILSLQKEGKPIIVGAIKGTQYDTHVLGSDKYLADITVEMAPGFYHNNLTLPVELIELIGERDHFRGQKTDPSNNYNPKITMKPEPVQDQVVDVGNSSKIKGGDYKLAGESYTSMYVS